MSVAEFQILRKLGEGAYSTVYKVQRRSDGQHYALKKVRFSPLKEKEKQNALTEVRVLASVSHPHIVAYKESFVESHALYIVMELAAGGDLFSKIRAHRRHKTRFKESDLWAIFIQSALALKALHDLQILHRDFKSANVFFDEHGKVKIGDLNVSKVAKGKLVYTQTGTPYYASPEVWKDLPYDAKSDIWSLGCVLYEAAALKPPFMAKDMSSLYQKVVRGKFPPLPTMYSDELNDLIRMMLRVNPYLRPNLTMLISMPSVQKNCQGLIFNPSQSNLINTIKLTHQIDELCELLPAPRYRKVDFKRKFMTPKPQRHSNLNQNSRRTPDRDLIYPLRNYPQMESENDNTIASKIRELKKILGSENCCPSRKKHLRPVVKGAWWE